MMYSNYHWVEVFNNSTHIVEEKLTIPFFPPVDTDSQNLRPPRFPLNRKLPIVGDLYTLRTWVYSYTRSVQCSCWDAYTSELHCKQIGFFSSFVLISFGSSASWILIMNINSPRHRHSSQQQCFWLIYGPICGESLLTTPRRIWLMCIHAWSTWPSMKQGWFA